MDRDNFCKPKFLLPHVKTYDWGKRGTHCLVYEFWKRSYEIVKMTPDPKLLLQEHSKLEEIPFAELWYGSHSLGTCLVVDTSRENILVPLNKFLAEIPCFTTNTEPMKHEVAYMLKILSIAKPLSLQCHPDLNHAKALHEINPKVYPDTNHKPEMCIALTSNVQVLCGFRPYKETSWILSRIRELNFFYKDQLNHLDLSSEAWEMHDKNLECSFYKGILERTVNASSEEIIPLFSSLQSNIPHYLDSVENPPFFSQALRVFLDLCGSHPNDSGCLSCFFLNVFFLKPGDCINVPPNTLHGYLKGELLECMACSDNVIRGGMTSKFKDIPTLLKVTNYACSLQPRLHPRNISSSFLNRTSRSSPEVWCYRPETGNFQIVFFRLPAETSLDIPMKLEEHSPYIFMVLSGELMVSYTKDNKSFSCSEKITVKQGQSLLIPSSGFFHLSNPSGSVSQEILPLCSELFLFFEDTVVQQKETQGGLAILVSSANL